LSSRSAGSSGFVDWPVILDTDAQEVVRAMNSAVYANSAVVHLIEEIKLLLSSKFINFECVFVARICNEAAHELATWGNI
jgi:hypothetical protein